MTRNNQPPEPEHDYLRLGYHVNAAGQMRRLLYVDERTDVVEWRGFGYTNTRTGRIVTWKRWRTAKGAFLGTTL